MPPRVPYTQQFTPQQTPLAKLQPILRQNSDDQKSLKNAIAAAFYKDKIDADKLAGNTLIALQSHQIIDKSGLTAFGKELVAAQGPEEAHRLLAKNILINLNGIALVETLREMGRAGLPISLKTLPDELRQRGFAASSNSSDLSGVLNWLREAGVLVDYNIVEDRYAELVGAQIETLDALKELESTQIAFLKAAVALNVQDWTPYNTICKHAEQLYAGEIQFNWKDIDRTVLKPLKATGFIEIRKREKEQNATPAGRGGKPADIRPTGKFEKDLAEPLLDSLYKSAGFSNVRAIRSKSLAEIVADIEQKTDHNKSGKALEYLAVRLCQLLNLDFMGWRETDIEVAGGGEVDAMLHAARLIYSRWQVQCKVGQITLEAVAKEVGLHNVTLANVILIVSTGRATDGAQIFKRKIISTSNLNIIFIDGNALRTIIGDNSTILDILRTQAQDALRLKPTTLTKTKIGGGGSQGGQLLEADAGAAIVREVKEQEDSARQMALLKPKVAYSTKLGVMFHGDVFDVLPLLIEEGVRAKLIVTSPPFALVRKKEYGNEDADMYLQWFHPLIDLFKKLLQPDGNVVIDIGGSWIPGIPAKSTYHFKLLLDFCANGFYLAQDFYHYNPARLPTPAEWVTVRRLRVKDAVNNVWWLTLDPFVEVNNKSVLLPYSSSMKGLLRNGYKPALRPSGHDISDKFQRDNGGSIPPNVLTFANTESNSDYIRQCRALGIKPHPARFPQALPDFFIKFLTKPGDLVLDPFAGSNVSGASAESLGRKWVGIELSEEYIAGSKLRFRLPVDDRPITKAPTGIEIPAV